MASAPADDERPCRHLPPRPAGGPPLIVHLADLGHAEYFCGLPTTRVAWRWPSGRPVTVIVPAPAGAARPRRGHANRPALPAHAVAHALLLRCAERGVPGVAAPVPNRYGRISRRGPACDRRIRHRPDGARRGACPVGIESTIVDCSRDRPCCCGRRVEREALEPLLGRPLDERDAAAAASGDQSRTTRRPPAALAAGEQLQRRWQAPECRRTGWRYIHGWPGAPGGLHGA